MVDSRGILGSHRDDIKARRNEFAEKWQLCETTNRSGRRGGIAEAMKDVDVVISLSKPEPGTIESDWVRSMRRDPIVFACANPTPEIWPWDATEAGAAVVATGRSDFPNQVNNSVCFPAIFRGALDVRARTITDEMCFTAAEALASAVEKELSPTRIIPTMEDRAVFPFVATEVGLKAQEQGVAQLAVDRDTLLRSATEIIERSHRLTGMMMQNGLIAAPEEEL